MREGLEVELVNLAAYALLGSPQRGVDADERNVESRLVALVILS